MNQEQSAEFKWFETIQNKLAAVFSEEYSHVNAQELAFLVAQAIRDVPTLLGLLEDSENHSNDEILNAVHSVIANHSALSEAAKILTTADN